MTTSAGDSRPDAVGIKALDAGSVHKISSGQVVVDLQTAVKELVENSLDAGATNIEVRFKEYGLEMFEVVDNGSGIPPEDYDSIALKHHTSKLSSFTDLQSVATFGFRGEALSSLCALAESVTVTTATAAEAPVGTVIEFERTGKAKGKKGKAARQRGTTVTVTGLFKPLPVRRKELERNAKREFGKALTLLHAYALVPCAKENKGVRLTVTNQTIGGKKTVQLRTDGIPSTRASVSAIWGPKALENLVELTLTFVVEVEAAVLRRLGKTQDEPETSNQIKVRGLISKFAVGCGRNGTDRQFFFVNGRPCSPSQVQKAFNEVYRSFNATQSPFVIADFILPTNSCDINVSPDKRTILLHSENNLVQALRIALEEMYAPSRSTYDINASQVPRRTDSEGSARMAATQPREPAELRTHKDPLFLPEETGDDASSAVSQTAPDSPIAGPSGPSAVDLSDKSDELTFGEPTLLSQPSSSSAPLASQEHDVHPEVEVEEAHADRAEEVRGIRTFEADVDVDMDAVIDEGVSAKARPNANANLVGVRLRSRTPTRVLQALDEHGLGATESEGKTLLSPAVTEMSQRLVGRMSPAAIDDSLEDAPIPSLRPPARPVVRASSHPPRSNSEQMVLSTSGASWNLRRAADEALVDRPKKKPKVDASRDGRGARQGMRELLRGFARTGSQVAEAKMDIDEDDDDADAEDDEQGPHSDGEGREELVSNSEGEEEREEDEAEVQDARSSGVAVGDDERMDMDEDKPSVEQVIDLTQGEDRDVPEPLTGRSDLGDSSVSATNEEIVRTTDRESVPMAFDLCRVMSSWDKLRTHLADVIREREERDRITEREMGKLDSAGIGNGTDDEEAVEALSRVIDKDDFANMEIVGQFNLGFIIVRRRKSRTTNGHSLNPEMDDLFIVDQHAADEKYNFETLQRTTKIDSQKLFRPQVLELAAADEIVALENIEVLRQNGFELDVSEDRAPGQRMQLTAQPISKSTVFDMKDLEELLHLMQDRPTGQMVRCSKARAMFAMRACRKSIMIGTPLNRRQMTSVVQHMGAMDQPWHCPHGRPTMRHLSDIVGVGWHLQHGSVKSVDWVAFGRTATASKG